MESYLQDHLRYFLGSFHDRQVVGHYVVLVQFWVTVETYYVDVCNEKVLKREKTGIRLFLKECSCPLLVLNSVIQDKATQPGGGGGHPTL